MPRTGLPQTRMEWVYDLLKEKILSSQYEPLQRLVADQVARELGTSVIPVREALRRLESEGLVEMEPYVGARVAPIREADMMELFAIRKALEPLLARSAIGGVTPEALADLEALCAEMDACVAAGDMLEYSRKNFRFHKRIYDLSTWKTLYGIVQSVWDRSARSRWVHTLAPSQAVESQQEHRAMIDALRLGDADLLEELCARQKERAFQLYLAAVRQRSRAWTEM